jgi:hypothetical protein
VVVAEEVDGVKEEEVVAEVVDGVKVEEEVAILLRRLSRRSCSC